MSDARHPVPWITQYASPSLIDAIAYKSNAAVRSPATERRQAVMLGASGIAGEIG